MKPQLKPIVILSACRGEYHHEDNVNHDTLIYEIQSLGIACSGVLGVYQGKAEKSVLCTISSSDEITSLIALAERFNQESILMADEERDAVLYFLSDKTHLYLGKLGSVDSVDGVDNYTIVTIHGEETYWTTESEASK